ncbi:MAG: branched chain amino acid aminotransferase [SAR202 cluster bacterium Io17-Chloro-G3]|nr:MAG: branched chain amino acid aminotransferase [SAR202 cluster bacterium Io17-Chloro-G3]
MPPVAFHKRAYVPLEQASIGVMTHAFHYGTGIFEGIRGNWNDEEERIVIFRIREHYERLLQGCSLLHIKLPYSVDDLCEITVEMVERSGYREDLYIRPLAYKSTERVATLNLHTLDDDFTVFAIPFGAYMDLEAAAHCCTSSWRRLEDTMIPPGAKISGMYVNSILAKSDAVAAGFDEALLMNQAGYVCEGTGENLFILRNGKLATPPLEDNVLPGITRATVIDIARNEMGLEVEERHILRTELYLVDELFLTGTAAHLTPVGMVDHRSIGDGKMGPVTRELQTMYFDIVRGKNPAYRHWCTLATPRLEVTA